MKLYDSTFMAARKAMDLRFRRHTVLASNAANADTPGFKARDLNFAGELDKALGNHAESLKKTHAGHMDVSGDSAQSHMVLDNTMPVGADGNNVDMDINQGRMATNARGYQSAATYLSIKLRILRNAARGRGGM